MTSKTIIASVIVCILLSLSLVTLLLFSPSLINTIYDFPFRVEGGTLINQDTEELSGVIWGQSFEIVLYQVTNDTFQTRSYSISILNFVNSNINISGLTDTENCRILTNTSCELELTVKKGINRTIILKSMIRDESEFKILAIGDTQGFPSLYESMLLDDVIKESSFILHLGDITPSGSDESLKMFHNITSNSKIPVYSTPGNHDIKESKSTRYYERFFGVSEYYFKYLGFIFISLNSSSGYFSEESFSLINSIQNEFPSSPKILFTHIPLFDPRPGKNHTLINSSQSTRMLSLLESINVKAVISGHIHFFNHTVLNEIHFITSGGGGAYLYEDPEEGGYYHFTEITVGTLSNDVSVNPIPLTKDIGSLDLTITKGEIKKIVSNYDLISEFSSIQGYSSFQNQFNNWRANGTYIGVKISSLLATVGGMGHNDVLIIESWDGLKSNFSYPVIYPNSTWKEIQGEIILAYSFLNQTVPTYEDGYRIVFLPPDGGYSNEDCENTSPPGEGWYIWPSAGYRWMKYVKSLTIITNGNS
jgi:3',5'-cyclic AMP phosphodiesterase CpdA